MAILVCESGDVEDAKLKQVLMMGQLITMLCTTIQAACRDEGERQPTINIKNIN